ncbi:MAG: hypothetical protein IPH83_09005 [Gammaproteobacteria bacterium]|nr:hypothetical protein [Gammaproteobacteria bacterium]
MLARRSDALVLLTATPHSGDKESFASLMRMLDPTVLPRGVDYTREDIEHLFVRRFKGDVREQIKASFPERQVFQFLRRSALDARSRRSRGSPNSSCISTRARVDVARCCFAPRSRRRCCLHRRPARNPLRSAWEAARAGRGASGY